MNPQLPQIGSNISNFTVYPRPSAGGPGDLLLGGIYDNLFLYELMRIISLFALITLVLH